MKRIVAGLAGMLALSGAAYAQTGDATGYVEAVAQSAFGNVTSQSFGGEAGYFVTPRIGIFIEAGQVRDSAPSELGAAATRIGAALSQSLGSTVGFTVRQPLRFGAGGIRYAFGVGSPKIQPYVLGGGGVANIKHDVKFTVGGTDVTSGLAAAPYYVTLGSDLAGTVTKPMMVVGGGINYRTIASLRIDLGYRFSRIFTDNSGTNVNRVGIGVGITF